MKAFESIPMPSEEEKAQAITEILSASDLTGVGLRAQLASIKKFSISTLFFGLGDCMFLAVLFALICVVPTSLAATEQGPVVPMLFLLSPVLYAALHLLTWWKETLSGTLEWKQTCRLSFGMMTALRMLVFGGAATLLCVPQCFLMWFVIGRKISFLFMLSVSFSSLFLYAALALALRKSRWGIFFVPVFWLVAGIVMLCWERASIILLEVPSIVFFLLAVAAFAAVLFQLSMMLHSNERGQYDAVR